MRRYTFGPLPHAMERIGIVGIGWRQGGPEGLARFTLAPDERAQRLPEIARRIGARELVYLATCNRVEIAFAVERPASIPAMRASVQRALTGAEPLPGEAERTLKAWAGEGAAEHLFCVAAGLDSARLGESEIAGQVRKALDEALALGLAGPRLATLFEEALKVARRVRQATGIGDGRTSLAEIALERVRERLADARAAGVDPLVALVGVSAMTKRIAQELSAERSARLLVLNRSVDKARALCADLGDGARARSLADFLAHPEPATALVTATAAPEPLFGERELAALAESCEDGLLPTLVDLAVPPDVDAAAAKRLGFERCGMDEILARARATHSERERERADARALVDEALVALRRRWSGRAIDAAAVAVQRHYGESARRELERLLQRELASLDEGERDALRAFVERLAKRFAHLPTSGLRALASEAGGEALAAFVRGADAELARELAAALDEGPELVDAEERA